MQDFATIHLSCHVMLLYVCKMLGSEWCMIPKCRNPNDFPPGVVDSGHPATRHKFPGNHEAKALVPSKTVLPSDLGVSNLESW